MPAPDIRESPSREYSIITDASGAPQYTALRVFTASWFSDEEAVRAALAAMPTFPVDAGQPHPLNPSMTCEGPEIKQAGVNFYNVTAKYSTGGKQGSPGSNPLNFAPTIAWEDSETTESFDVDVFGNGICNSAGNSFPPLSDLFGGDILVIARNEPWYDPGRNLTYRLKVNSDNFSPLNMFTVEPGQARCRSIRPTQAYHKNDPYVNIAYRFELRAGNKKDADGLWDGFKHRLLDQGRMGFWNPGGGVQQGQLLCGSAPPLEPVPQDIKLDGTGKPQVAGISCGDRFNVGTPVANPAALPVQVYKDNTGSGVFLKYTRFYTSAFAGIGL